MKQLALRVFDRKFWLTIETAISPNKLPKAALQTETNPESLLLYFSPATTKKNRKSIVIERNSNKSKGIQMSI
jgi:ribosome recycling factor